MRKGWLLAATGLGLLFAVFGVQASRLPLMDELGPGPGFFPLAISVLGGALAIVLAADVGRNWPKDVPDAKQSPGLGRVLSLLAVVVVAMLVFEPLGYTLTTLVLVPIVLFLLGARSPVAIGAVSIVMSVGVFHVFYAWLNVALPVGLFGI